MAKALQPSKWAEIRKLWKEANPMLKKASADSEVAVFWKEHKRDADKIQLKINELKLQKKNRRNPVAVLFQKAIGKELRNDHDQIMPVSIRPEHNLRDEETQEDPSSQECEDVQESTAKITRAYKQVELQKELDDTNEKIVTLTDAKRLGLCNDEEISQKLKLAFQKRDEVKNYLKRRRNNQLACIRARKKRKDAEKQNLQNPNAPGNIPLVRTVGRPRLESTQEGLNEAILDLVLRSCTADEKRRCETLQYQMHIQDLLRELQNQGFNISRQGLCLRFFPRNKASKWGQRHHTTVNVKLAKAKNTLRKEHPDTHFAAATVNHLKNLAVMFGQNNVMLLSVDDKAKVPLGLPAAKRQGAILMRLDYEIRLPDHDWVVGTRHKLTPSVIAGICIGDTCVTYSGPTMISIRSGKHDSSTAESHATDFRRFITLEKFEYFTKRSDGRLKPILIMFVDGGPDENPRYPKTLAQAIQNFLEYNFDAIFIASYAPHQSSSNPVERRMAPLSKDLVGVILPHEHFGTHLNSGGKTVDRELEIQNFDKAGHVLANLWNGKLIDKHEVVAEYVHPPGQERCLCDSSPLPRISSDLDDSGLQDDLDPAESITEVNYEGVEPRMHSSIDLAHVSEEWKVIHVRQSQYTLQIVKCTNPHCCRPPVTNLTKILPERFLSAPILYQRTLHGIDLAITDDSNSHFWDLTHRIALHGIKVKNAPNPLPFDWFCPSLKETVISRTCSTCGIYFPSKIGLTNHRKMHLPAEKETLSHIEVDDTIDFVVDTYDNADNALVIDNLDEWYSPVFIEVETGAN